jgi:hypothetical protein
MSQHCAGHADELFEVLDRGSIYIDPAHAAEHCSYVPDASFAIIESGGAAA